LENVWEISEIEYVVKLYSCGKENLWYPLMECKYSVNESVRMLLDGHTELIQFEMLIVNAAVDGTQRIFTWKAEGKDAEMTLRVK